jgi:DNA-binding NtrC family response regulator
MDNNSTAARNDFPEVRILLVDDGASDREQLAQHLRNCGYQVDEFADPGDLHSSNDIQSADLMVIRGRFAEETGLFFAEGFHRQAPSVPVLLITSGWSENLALETGRHGYLWLRHEPLDMDEIRSLLNYLRVSPGRRSGHR